MRDRETERKGQKYRQTDSGTEKKSKDSDGMRQRKERKAGIKTETYSDS